MHSNISSVQPVQALPAPSPEEELLPVAAYCRVSTQEDSQESSIQAQQEHWESVIAAHPGWCLAGIYAEAGLSGTQAETRPALMRLMGDCALGRVRRVLTKSISRFSRNTVDCLRLVRSLQAMGVSVLFEKENIDTGSMTSELFLSLLASFAAEESRSLSRNVKLGYRHRFQAGEFKYKRPPYGYDAVDGELVINQRESEAVVEVFSQVISGRSPTHVANLMELRGIPTKYNAGWTYHTVTMMIGNLTYTGDCLLQKTYRDEQYKPHWNQGEWDRYYIPDHHEAIVSREVFILANQALGYGDPYSRLQIVPGGDNAAEEEGEGGEKKVTVIKADARDRTQKNRQRVAAYCRVSTDSDEQETSYEAQCSHYHDVIANNKNWILAGIYADEGLSGTTTAHRDQFNRMIRDAEDGQIDLILTKSISRFARNTLDCLSVVRKLRDLEVGVIFEKEGLDTLDSTGEVVLTILASIAQQESASISQNVRLGIQYRFQQGLPMVNCNRFLGYEKDKKGRLVIQEAQAAVVRRIYRDFLDGYSVQRIAGDLRRERVPSGSGSVSWPASSVHYILTNEKYAGDLLLQKTLIADFLTHKPKKNQGQLPQYFVENAHPPIVPKSVFQRAADELFLRSQDYTRGEHRFGSRRALVGRTFCPCGLPMKRLRRAVPVWVCECGREAAEGDVKEQVLSAVLQLPDRQEDIRRLQSALSPALQSPDRLTRARAQRVQWQLENLLPPAVPPSLAPACDQEEDFRARTSRRLLEWDDDALLRILERVVVNDRVVFRGGLEVTLGVQR